MKSIYAKRNERSQTIKFENNTPIIPIDQVTEYAKASMITNSCLIMLGGAGTAKTASIKGIIAPYLDIPSDRVVIFNFSGSAPSDVKGFGYVELGDMKFSLPPNFPSPTHPDWDKQWIFAFDELPNYYPEVQAALHSCISPDGDPKIGSHSLPPNSLFIITGNRRKDGAKVSQLTDPQVTRGISVIIEPSLDGTLDHFSKIDLGGTATFAFLQFSCGLSSDLGVDHFCPDPPTPYVASPRPCPRRWEAALILAKEYKEESELYRCLLASTVGEKAADACFNFCCTVAKTLPIVADIQAGNINSTPTTIAELYAVIHTATRIAIMQVKDAIDPSVAVVSGTIDWYMTWLASNKVSHELKQWAFDCILEENIGIEDHSLRAKVQGV